MNELTYQLTIRYSYDDGLLLELYADGVLVNKFNKPRQLCENLVHMINENMSLLLNPPY